MSRVVVRSVVVVRNYKQIVAMIIVTVVRTVHKLVIFMISHGIT